MFGKAVKASLCFWLYLLLLISFTACSQPSLLLATTTSTYDSGLLGVLLPPFKKETNIKVEVIAVGTGQALSLGRRGDVDVILGHSPEQEEEFMAQGYGIERHPIMYNDFVLVGPFHDPAGVRGLDILPALGFIARKGSLFVSRGDDSGTHHKERKLWAEAGIKPQGDWYLIAGQGMGQTLTLASEKGAYTLSDRATFLAQRERLRLTILVEGGQRLFNPYSIIAVNPAKHPRVNYQGAKKLIQYLTSPQAQRIIEQFGRGKYGHSLFYPYTRR